RPMRRLWRGPRHVVRAWRGWRRASWAERRQFAQMALAIPFMHVAVRVRSFQSTIRWVRQAPARGTATVSSSDTGAQTMKLATALRRAALFGPYAGNCLSRSLALLWLMKRHGVDAELCLGARMEEGQLAAHAWVESGGRIINDRPDVREKFAQFRPSGTRPI